MMRLVAIIPLAEGVIRRSYQSGASRRPCVM
jgi:hypothetical protein